MRQSSRARARAAMQAAGGWVLCAGLSGAPAILPSDSPWAGASRALVAPSDHRWRTPAEQSGFARTPHYDETIAWLRRLCAASRDLELVDLGTTAEGRTLHAVIAARGARRATASAVRALGRPVVFVQAGIHAGEIDGKDAGLMLLRDCLPGARLHDLLSQVSLVFVPVLNADGHERASPWGRLNQRGPDACGWRTTATNLNLNRDYTKLDAPETRAVVAALVEWDPELYVDLHVTDGGDYQYDVTWCGNGAGAYSRATQAWLDSTLTPAAEQALTAAGHVPGPFMLAVDDDDWTRGLIHLTLPIRFSNAYGDARHTPTILVENHSLKPYERRVLGTYVFLEAVLRTVARQAPALRQAIASDRARRDSDIVLEWRAPAGPPRRTIEWAGIASRREFSPVTGDSVVRWLGRPVTLEFPRVDQDEAVRRVERPAAYWIPAAWSEVASRLAAHGIAIERQPSARTLDVEKLHIVTAKLDTSTVEGRVRVLPTVEASTSRETFAAGSWRVSTDQRLGDLAVLLLEPEAPDSFFQWGFFHAVLQRTEYGESYILEPMAARALGEDPALRAEFERRLREDKAFAADPKQRLDWFYRRTAYYDQRVRVYPIARER